MSGSTAPAATCRGQRRRCPASYLEDLCFNAQQAAEKAIKAVLIARGVDFPLIHDLARLLTLLDQEIPPDIAAAARLTRFAAVTRYLGVAEPVTIEEHQRAVVIAAAVVRWADGRIGGGRAMTRDLRRCPGGSGRMSGDGPRDFMSL